ncbi:MAG: transposase [Candidatus Competibacteraceae bacterium]|nr:transposase [Candidatus Competibacteraceae bacterium]
MTYRLVCFYVFGEWYRMTTNRLDLKTSEIIILYAYRWQVELFFRVYKANTGCPPFVEPRTEWSQNSILHLFNCLRSFNLL